MDKRVLKIDKRIHFEPKLELKYLLSFSGIIIYMFFVNEFFSEDEAEKLRGQSKIAYGLFIVFLVRIFTFKQWGEKYKEVINFLTRSVPFDLFVRVCVLNVLLDVFVLFSLFVLIEVDKISFIPITVVGIVYIIMIGIAFTRQVATRKSKTK